MPFKVIMEVKQCNQNRYGKRLTKEGVYSWIIHQLLGSSTVYELVSCVVSDMSVQEEMIMKAIVPIKGGDAIA